MFLPTGKSRSLDQRVRLGDYQPPKWRQTILELKFVTVLGNPNRFCVLTEEAIRDYPVPCNTADWEAE
jgi:hypothetical protein